MFFGYCVKFASVVLEEINENKNEEYMKEIYELGQIDEEEFNEMFQKHKVEIRNKSYG